MWSCVQVAGHGGPVSDIREFLSGPRTTLVSDLTGMPQSCKCTQSEIALAQPSWS